MNSKKVNDRVVKEFKQDAEKVLTLLSKYGPDHPEPERIQVAILDLAQGQLSKVASLVELALIDYRDVLYQAYFYNDPYNLLQALLADLQVSGTFTSSETMEVMRATGGTHYRDAFHVLLGLIETDGKSLTLEQYQSLDKLGRALKLPVKTWKKFAVHWKGR